MPGHKLGKGIPAKFLANIEKLDVTEIPGADNLHAPEGILREAQELAAEAFGARHSFFLVNGSTAGVHAAIAAVCRPGQRLIVGRDSHRSVINGMLLAGVRPFFILPAYSGDFCVDAGIGPGAVEAALREAPDAAGVLITRPNYYGICGDIAKISQIVHNHGKMLIVDEAHGAHLAFNERLPVCALKAGADICIQGAHKTLPAFTQGAYLHVGSDLVDVEMVRHFLGIYQTTSPSYVIMAFLDIAREIMQRNGSCLLDRLIDSIMLYGGMLKNSGIRLMGPEIVPGFGHDPTRVAVNLAGIGISGREAEKILRERYNIQAEMSDPCNIIFITTVADVAGGPESVECLFEALHALARDCGSRDRTFLPAKERPGVPVQAMEPSEVLYAPVERIPLKKAAGRISRDMVSPYPPGSAVICPGEKYDDDIVGFLAGLVDAGCVVHGVDKEGCVMVVGRK